MLSAIYIKGFKTFARPVRVPLAGGVAAIVGPNGSGKSNITDAVLFALGEGSPSLLRATSMSDLIFSGSDSLPPANAAEVTLVLENSERRLSLPYEEVSLSRRIQRSGETEYRINGARARLADIRVVAGEAGLGRHSILRQGAVDAIVSGGAAACRTALEEAAGLGVFRRRRLAASRKLEKAAAKLESSRQLETELSSQLERIRTEAVAAREYRELEARYRELSLAHLYQLATRSLDEGRKRLEALEETVQTLQARQDTLREEGRRLEEQEKELEEQVLAAEKVVQGLERGSEALRTGTLRAERALVRAEGAERPGVDRSRLAARLEAEFAAVSREVQRLEEQAGMLDEEYARRRKALSRLEKLVGVRRREHAEATRRRVRLAGELEDLSERRERARRRLEEPGASVDVDLRQLEEAGERLGPSVPDGLRESARTTLGRLEESRRLAAARESEAERRRGTLAALVGRTEAGIRSLRSQERPAANGQELGKRLYEVVRPRPGYEAAVEAALGELSGGVLAESLDEGVSLLSGTSGERVVVRLDATPVPRNGTTPGKPLLACVEILDASYADALERLLGGAYVIEGAGVPDDGYDVAVTSEGLRLTRTSASRPAPAEAGDHFARRARLAREEETLDALKNDLGKALYDLREIVSSTSRRLDEKAAEVEVLSSSTSRTARASRLLVSEAARRAKRARASRERRAEDEAKLSEVGARLLAAEEELRGAREGEERTEEGLGAALSETEAAHAGAREVSGRLARTRADLERARGRRSRISRGLSGLAGATAAEEKALLRASLARRAAHEARRLEEVAGGRLGCLRALRSEAAGAKSRASAGRLAVVEEAAGVSGEVLKARSRAAALGAELTEAEETARSAEASILDEWGATLEAARSAAEALSEPTGRENADRERARLARKLKSFGDVNLLAISQESALRERYEFVAAQRADAEEASTEIERIIRNVDGEIEARFGATFAEARRTFGEMAPRMLAGAKGELSLSEEGVEIGLRLEGRGWRPLRVLSGGERSLLALAFLFSLFLGRSVRDGRSGGAFCMLDEAEAALDDVNLSRFLAVVDSYRADGQFLLVTHQKRTMAAADVLYGVAPDGSGASSVVSKRLTGD